MRTNCTICKNPAEACGAKRDFQLYRCSACGHFFVWPMPADNLDIYSDEYFSGAQGGFGYTDYDRDKQAMIPTFGEYLRRIEAVYPRKGELFDVGAATGFFLDIAKRGGWQVSGVEPSDHAASLARAKGIDVRTGTLDENDAARLVDVVTMWDVVEHLPDPAVVIKSVHSILKTGGVLAINTPDSGSLLAKALGTKWHLVVPPEHLNLFTRSSLRILLEGQGFEVLETRTIGKRFTIQYVLQIAGHWLKLKFFDATARWAKERSIGRWGVSINLFDNVFLLARKK
jgi:SAM-dependent methyltransferase